MATRTRAMAHTAGIFSDMTVDGPEIGTLVTIVDRAKNLPNRKTIGKQDPYCAARLGKEAKKTETDRRGGQTPRWDQELRFTVHDSPDYYQLKVSVFNDDKKTDLIGETWVNLQEVIVPGGGQSDVWHTLNCKGKYAGEIRIEMTYYDTRPKEERVVEKVKQPASVAMEEPASTDSLKGPRQPQQKGPVKRRPLPSDPVTGIAPPAPMAAPAPAPAPAPLPPTDHHEAMHRGYSQPQVIPQHVQAPVRGYSAPSAVPAHVQAPPRGHQSPNYIQSQSPLQSVEYNTPQHQQYSHPDSRYAQPESQYAQQEQVYAQPDPRYNEPRHRQPEPSYQSQSFAHQQAHQEYAPVPRAVTPTPSVHPDERYGYEGQRNAYSSGDVGQRYEEEAEHFDPYQNNNHQSPYELPQNENYGSPPSPGGPPPPPPVHRSRHGSAQPSPLPPLTTQGSYGAAEKRPNPLYHQPASESHRHSMPNYETQSYQPYRSPTRDRAPSPAPEDYRESPPRHHSYDSRYDHQRYNSMQPTVEDAPSSPSVQNYGTSPSYRGSNSYNQSHSDSPYAKVPSPAPLNLSGRGSATSGRNSASTTPSHQYSNSSANYGPPIPQLSHRDRANTDTVMSSRTSYNPLPQHKQPTRRMSEDPSGSSYNLPPVPPSLVAGMDPLIAQEISDRIYDEKRASYNRPNGQSPRGTYQNSPHFHSNRPHPLSYQEQAQSQYDPAPVSPYEDREGRFVSAQTAVVKPRAISPDPRRVVRKSVSPAPGPPPGDESRRLSGVPFGPDSYNALNPSIAGSTSIPSLSAKYDTKEPDPDAKIITHDGREVDPSDHIPESNYAPLREVKGPKYASQQPDRNYRPPPSSNAQGTPNSGRRPLRQAGRPQSMAAIPPVYQNPEPHTPTNRNRLQKKSNRMSAQPVSYSSPLAPVTPHQDNSYTPRSQGRGNIQEYASENYAPQYGSSPGHRGSFGPPPIPAKVPVQGAPPPHNSGSGDPWALLEEMKNIDLGSGRARRRNY